MIKKYNINDYLKGDRELQKAVIQELLDDLKCAVMNVENLLETKQRLKGELAELKAENERLKSEVGKLTQTCGSLLNIQYALADGCKKYSETLQEIKAIAEPFAKCYTHTCRNCEKYDSAHACCLKDINCYKYNDGSKSSCIDFVLPTKQFYQQILANIITKITKAEEE